MSTGRLVVAVTGASGAIYARRFLAAASRSFSEIHVTLSGPARLVARTELGLKEGFSHNEWLAGDYPNVRLVDDKDFFTPPASGSFRHDGMVIVPCSMGTIGRIANGVSDDLTSRAADVCLKEGRKLIVVPREMPWSLIMLRNLTRLVEAGATVLPACPAWYHNPATLDELADTVVDRILQNLGVQDATGKEWMAD